jgi:hypothetical protein
MGQGFAIGSWKKLFVLSCCWMRTYVRAGGGPAIMADLPSLGSISLEQFNTGNNQIPRIQLQISKFQSRFQSLHAFRSNRQDLAVVDCRVGFAVIEDNNRIGFH